MTDLNECAETDRGGCTQGCQNNIGAFTCFCGNGYTLNVDGKTCDGKLFFPSISFMLNQPINYRICQWLVRKCYLVWTQFNKCRYDLQVHQLCCNAMQPRHILY